MAHHETGTLRRLLLIAAIAIVAAFVGSPIQAAEGVAQLAKARGEVLVTRAGTDAPLAAGAALLLRDIVKTGAKARAQIQFIDGSTVTLGENSALSIDRFAMNATVKSRNVVLSALGGVVNALATKSDESVFDYQIRTPGGYSAVRGTNWIVAVQSGLSSIYVLNGLVQVGSVTGNRVLIQAGQSVQLSDTGAINNVQPIAPDVMQQVIDATDVASANAAPEAAAPAAPDEAPTAEEPDAEPSQPNRAPQQNNSGGGGSGGGGGHGGM